jgi:tetratricopeptide (TPR) repeat protein
LQRIGGLRLLHADYDVAERPMREALALLTKAGLPKCPETVRVHQSLALLQQARGQYRSAEVSWRTALRAADAVWGRRHPETAKVLLDFGELQRVQRHVEAETLLNEALHICEQQLPGNHPQLATVLIHLARLNVDQRRFSEAEALYRRSLTMLEGTLGPEHALVATVLSNLAGLLSRVGNEYEAEQSYRRAIDIKDRVLGPNHPRVAADLIAYAKLLRTKDKGGQTFGEAC